MHPIHTPVRRSSRWVAAAAAVLATATLAACTGATPSDDDEPLRLTIAVPTVTVFGDPAQDQTIAYDNYEVQAVYEGLGYWDFAAGELVPVLAESFELADDALSLDVTLRDDVDFTDGTHLDAAGAVKFYEYLLASEVYAFGPTISAYEPSFEATGEYTFTISTTTPIYFPISFGILIQTPIVSPTAIDDPESLTNNPIGTGPYLIDEVTPDAELTLVRNPDYWDPEAYPYDEIVLKVFADPVAKLNALKSGQVDVAELTPALGAEAEAAGLTILERNFTYQTLIVQDPENSPVEALRDVRVRQAIMHAFDRDAIAESVYGGLAMPAYQAYLPDQPEYVEGGNERYGYDVEKARQLMAEAGYADGFALTLPTNNPELEPIVQQSLADIGITVTFDGLPADSFVANVDGSHPMGFFGSLYVNSTRLLGENFAGLGQLVYPGEEVEELLAEIKGSDPEAAAEAAAELGELSLEELWYLPIVSASSIWASKPGVVIEADPVWVIILRDFQVAD